MFCLKCMRSRVSPYSIQGSDGCSPASRSSLFSDEELSEMVGQFTGLPHERLILQLFSSDLLIDALQAHHERAVTEPADGRLIIYQLARLRSLEVALLNLLQHTEVHMWSIILIKDLISHTLLVLKTGGFIDVMFRYFNWKTRIFIFAMHATFNVMTL